MAKLRGPFDFTKEGKGVSKNQTKEKRRFFLFFELYFRKLSKMILFNVVYFFICIPIITIGPATAALTYCMRNIAREEHVELSDFFEQFKKNFWKSIVVWLVFTVGSVIMVFGIIFYDALAKKDSIFGFFGLTFSIIAAVIFLFMSYYVYMILVTFKVNFRQLFKNSFIFAFVGLGRNIITTLILGIIYGYMFIYFLVPVFGPIFNPEIPASLGAAALSLALYIFFIPALASFVTNFNIYPCVKRFMLDPALAKQQQNEEESIFEDAE